MNVFTASNGVRIQVANGLIEWALPDSDVFGDMYDYMTGSMLDSALAEMYRGLEDERLGRWRWPEAPDHVVYSDGDLGCLVLTENTGYAEYVYRSNPVGENSAARAARAYFDAHPEPKPWHDAKPSEVWQIATASTGPDLYVVENTGNRFIHVERRLLALEVTATEIVSGRRIFPEVS